MRRLEQEDSEFEASLKYMVIYTEWPCFKKSKYFLMQWHIAYMIELKLLWDLQIYQTCNLLYHSQLLF